MDWRMFALCADMDPEEFSPVTYEGPGAVQAAKAKAVCRDCPVRTECLADTYEEDVWTIRGGLTPLERRA